MSTHTLLNIDTAGFQALVIRVDAHPVSKASTGRITPAEAAVARAAVAGLSNREIAKRRKSSPRTVAEQLRRVYGKLGVHSRSELAAVVD
jgi:DNA-binding NarL/FixJ family response regulator